MVGPEANRDRCNGFWQLAAQLASILQNGRDEHGAFRMTIAASVDRLISSLEAFKVGLPAGNSTELDDKFSAVFADATSALDAMTQETAVPATMEATDIVASTASTPSVAETSFIAFQSQDWLADTQSSATLNKPNMREFMDATGVDAIDASELLYGVVGSNADLRDWDKIMASGNPIDAARAATGQMYSSDKDYALVNHEDYGTLRYADTLAEKSLSSKTVLSQTGNFADIETDAGTAEKMAVSSTGLLLRGAGSTQAQIERTAWLFGFSTDGLFV